MMGLRWIPAAALAAALLPAPARAQAPSAGAPDSVRSQMIELPEPRLDGEVAVERALQARRSVRSFATAPLPLEQLGQILWAAQGITAPRPEPPAYWDDREWPGGLRTAPSAGALYPLEVYIVAGNVAGLRPGVYRYLPREHALAGVVAGEKRGALSDAALRQGAILSAPASIVIAADISRTAAKYAERAPRYVHLEAGAAAENACLQAQALGLASVFIGAFRDADVAATLRLPRAQSPLVILPIGLPPVE
jgi:SagB-type dehydrogenase family enzyme